MTSTIYTKNYETFTNTLENESKKEKESKKSRKQRIMLSKLDVYAMSHTHSTLHHPSPPLSRKQKILICASRKGHILAIEGNKKQDPGISST